MTDTAPAQDAIRIVGVNTDKTLIARVSAPASFTYRGGPLLTSVEVFTIFWGPAWTQQTQSDLAKDLNTFFGYIVGSPLLDQMAEFSVPGKSIGHGSFTGSITITTPALSTTVSDSFIQQTLQQEIINNSAVPAPSPNVLYFIYLPPGVGVTAFGAKSCQQFCGYHDAFAGQDNLGQPQQIFYAVMPFLDCPGCILAAPNTQLDAITSVSSHELCEAITDAVPGEGWYDDNNGEIGDICAWQQRTLGGYTIQQEWSNAQNQCV